MRVICVADLGVYAIHQAMVVSLPLVSTRTKCSLVDDIASLENGHVPNLSVPQRTGCQHTMLPPLTAWTEASKIH